MTQPYESCDSILRLVNTLDDQYGSYVHVSYDDLFLKKKNSLKESKKSKGYQTDSIVSHLSFIFT